jgi:hypothetical protein
MKTSTINNQLETSMAKSNDVEKIVLEIISASISIRIRRPKTAETYPAVVDILLMTSTKRFISRPII